MALNGRFGGRNIALKNRVLEAYRPREWPVSWPDGRDYIEALLLSNSPYGII
jgi:hypothetical protein